MTTGSQLVTQMLTHRGAPYSAGADRFGPTRFDCSGAIHNDLRELGVDDSGAHGWTSVTFQDWIVRTDQQSRSMGGPGFVGTLNVARTVPGMIVCHGHQSGPGGHIALTMGNNQVVETPSAEGHKLGVSSFDRNHYDFAGYLPGVTYPPGERFTPGAAVGLVKDTGCLPAGCTSGCALLLVGAPFGLLVAELLHLL